MWWRLDSFSFCSSCQHPAQAPPLSIFITNRWVKIISVNSLACLLLSSSFFCLAALLLEAQTHQIDFILFLLSQQASNTPTRLQMSVRLHTLCLLMDYWWWEMETNKNTSWINKLSLCVKPVDSEGHETVLHVWDQTLNSQYWSTFQHGGHFLTVTGSSDWFHTQF